MLYSPIEDKVGWRAVISLATYLNQRQLAAWLIVAQVVEPIVNQLKQVQEER